jgi:beta-lactamase class A
MCDGIDGHCRGPQALKWGILTLNQHKPVESKSGNPTWASIEAAIANAPTEVRVGISVRDITSGETFGHHDDLVFPAASTIKMVILIGLARAVDDGRLNLTDRAPSLGSQKVGGSGVLNWLETGLELTLADHAWLMIAISDNTASNVLIDAVGIPAIQDVQRSLGLESTSLNRRFLGRLPGNGEPENVACARDLTTIIQAIATGTAASPEMTDWMLNLLGDQQHIDRLPRHLPEGVTFAGKSGSLNRLSHDVGLFRSPKGPAVVAVLTQGFDDKYEADAFIGSIGAAAIDDLRLN